MVQFDKIGARGDGSAAGEGVHRTPPSSDSESLAGTTRDRPLSKAVGKAYEYIRVRILDGRLPPSSHLVEHVLAREIQVSRTPIREALRRLASDGFVSFVPNLGAKVVEWSDQSLADLIHVRSALAGMAATLAAPRIDTAALDQLRELNARLAQAASEDSPEALLEAARLTHAFHRVVFEASGNPWLLQLLDQTAYLPMIHRTHFLFNAHAWQGAIARYEDLIEALDARDAEWASSLMRAHFLTAEHRVRQHVHARKGNGDST
ncbi:MAG: GntR family transcriptional regulator [Burkholderiaceae bacterium]|nr:GntR family transcriptional regulator [Burkholderiaceae bacterium]